VGGARPFSNVVASFQKKRVLLIEDVALVRQTTRALIERHGLDVVELCNGVGAEDVVSQQQVDLVLTDLAMPDRDGAQTIRSLRQRYPKLPIVVLTGTALHSMAQQLGADESLNKPASPATLYAVLDELLRGH
jgi:CheY-like chemotaxis protein